MMGTSSNLDTFLNSHYRGKDSEKSITHTRIKSAELKITGGTYHIPAEDLAEFYEIYKAHVFQKGKRAYLTEVQIKNGPILVDFDFRYAMDVTTRQHDKEVINAIVILYTDVLKEVFDLKEVFFPIYIFEKPNVNVCHEKSCTKDGIHMIIGLKADHTLQTIIRSKVLDKIKSNYFESDEELPLTNSWQSVLDEGITSGHTNWQLYGSMKPKCEAYALTYAFEVRYNSNAGEFEMIEQTLSNCPFEKLTAQYDKHASFEMLPSLKTTYDELAANNNKPRAGNAAAPRSKLKIISNDEEISIQNIRNEKDLDLAIEKMIACVGTNDYHIKEAHLFTMLLPEAYYGQGSFEKWIRVGWALKNTHNNLFVTWIKFSSQSSEFRFSDITELYDKWNGFVKSADGLTHRSIMYWAKQDGPADEFKKIYKQTIDFFVREAASTQTEYDIANVMYQMFKDRYICVNIKNDIWYEFRDHKWVEDDSGTSLRNTISRGLHDVFAREADKQPTTNAGSGKGAGIALKLKQTAKKNNIMREARDIFYDKDFIKKQDTKSHLLCFNNGVFDFELNQFRHGQPEDYISKSCGINYVPIGETSSTLREEISQFMEQLFPVAELRDYMWSHLASTLIGTNDNQTFNMYVGGGRNGKSKLVELMSKCLGEYKGTVPITLITQKRNSIGGTSSEVAQLKGIRYAVMQEPSKGDVINEGIMKEITGGDPIQGRALYHDTITFIPQFKLCVCTNTLFDIKSTDDGTWRRIRICQFMSKFKEAETIDNDPDEPYQFPVDKKLEKKFDDWKEVMMSMLVEIARVSKGNVEECDIVTQLSSQYRESQDYLAEFVKEKVEKVDDPTECITQQEINEEFKAWYTLNYGGRSKSPSGKELFDYMTKKFGKLQNRNGSKSKKGWLKVRIIDDYDEEEYDPERT